MDSHSRLLPAEFNDLSKLAHNVWWSWSPEGRAIFSYLDQTLWRLTHHDPMRQLQKIAPARLDMLRQDPVFLRKYQAAMKAFQDYTGNQGHWFNSTYPHVRGGQVAYFSA